MKKYRIIAILINLLILSLIFLLIDFFISLNNKQRSQVNYIDVIASLFFCSAIYLLNLFVFRIIIKSYLPTLIIAIFTGLMGGLLIYFLINSFGIVHYDFTSSEILPQLGLSFIVGFILPYSERFSQRLLKDKYFKH